MVELTLGHRPLKIFMFIAEITDEFILRMDLLRIYNASDDLGCYVLRVGQEDILSWSPQEQLWLS
jgi:hypothetical protein